MTVRRLEELAHYYKRPTAALLLLEPPTEPPPPKDFRRPPHGYASFSPDLRFAIRRGYRFQRLAREMMQSTDLSYVSDIPQTNSQEDPESAAAVHRRALGISVQEQLGWKSPSEAFKKWREALEGRQVLVFQADFPRDEAQGFSLSESHPYCIVVTTKDQPPTARSFTLFHEFGHLLHREGGICLTEEALLQNDNSTDETENWCDRFAEAFLVDATVLQERAETHAVLRHVAGYEQELRHLASLFKVSQYVVLFRFRHLGLMSESQFWDEYNRVRQEATEAVEQQAKKKEKTGGPSPARQAVEERGRLFTRLILDGLEREMLSYTEAIDYLGVRLKHLDKMRQETYT